MIIDLINEALEAGIHLYVEDSKLRFTAKKGALSPELKVRIGQNKQAIIDYLTSINDDNDSGEQDTLVHQQRQDGTEVLSFEQQRLWFINQLEGPSAQYNVHSSMTLEGPLNIPLLEQAVNTIVVRHEVLRTVYKSVDGDGVQQVMSPRAVKVNLFDLMHESGEEQQASVQRLSQAQAAKVFDLSADQMLRITLIKTAPNNHVLVLTMHHIASDGWSLGILVSEFITLYQAFLQGKDNPLPPLEIQYADFAAWQRQQLQGEMLERQTKYWCERLSGIPQVHSLPIDKARPKHQDFRGRSFHSRIDQTLTGQLKKLTREHDVTLFMLLQTAYALLIGRFSNEQDVVIGSPIAGRNHKALAPLIGFFVNTLVLRTELNEGLSFSQLLSHNKKHILDAFSHQDISFEHLVDSLNPTRSFSHSPLFQLLFVLQSAQDAQQQPDNLEQLSIRATENDRPVVRYELELSALEDNDGIRLDWSFAEALFEQASIEHLASAFEYLLRQIVVDANLDIFQIKLTPDNVMPAAISSDKSTLGIHQLFEQQVARTPDAVALIYEDVRLSYSELNQKANRLADYLIDWGIEDEALVGICVERSPAMVIAILAVLKASVAYVPIEPNTPKDRAALVMEQSEMELMITNVNQVDNLPLDGVDVLMLDDVLSVDWMLVYNQENPQPQTDNFSQSLAYVLFTSGSTGRPKGVMVEHGGVVNYCRYVIEHYFTDKHQGAVVSSPLAFDATLTSLLPPLLSGRFIQLLNFDQDQALLQLEQCLSGQVPCLFKITPAHLQLLAPTLQKHQVTETEHVIVIGGEQLGRQTIEEYKGHYLPNSCFINEYGPTETVVGCCVYAVRQYQDIDLPGCPAAIAIGKAIANTVLLVLDSQGQPLPVGAVGELYIGGHGVARGYLNQDELTDKVFIERHGMRLYRTGDLVRQLDDGNLVFVGRIDTQVKLRGFRIELDEIRLQLQAHEQVQEAIVILTGEGELSQLLAYVASDSQEQDSLAAQLQAQLKAVLPEYMIPSNIMVLEALPLTANGKIDQRALPSPMETDVSEFIAPQTEIEQGVVEIWQDILKLDQPLGVNADFFALGGNSILATRFLSQVMARFDVVADVKGIFEYPRLKDFAAYIARQDKREFSVINRSDQTGPRQLSFSQQRLWFVDKLEGGSSQYNMPIALKLTGELNVKALEQAVHAIVERHEVLRTVFREFDGQPMQLVREVNHLIVTHSDFSHIQDPEQLALSCKTVVAEQAQLAFDLQHDLMLRAHLVRCPEQSWIFSVTVHHIASDGWSMGLLFDEFVQLYSAFSAAQDNPLTPLAIQYSDYALWQRQHVSGDVLDKMLDYWQNRLAGIPQIHSLAIDKPRPRHQDFSGQLFNRTINSQLTEQLNELAKRHDSSLFMVLQSAYAILISRFSHHKDIVIGSPVAGRSHKDIEPLIGFFVNTLVVRHQIDLGLSFSELLNKIKPQMLEDFAHQALSFEQLVDVLKPQRSLSHTPIFQLYFDLQQSKGDDVVLPMLKVEKATGKRVTVRYDLELSIDESNVGLELEWRYASALFEQQSIESMADCYERILEQLVAHQDMAIGRLPLTNDNDDNQRRLWDKVDDAYMPSSSACELSCHQLIENVAKLQPQAIALQCNDEQLTYQQLEQQANHLAHHLINSGLGKGSAIGIGLERGVLLPVALLAVLKAGGCYVPLDPAMPKQRLLHMVEDAQLTAVITTEMVLADEVTRDLDCFDIVKILQSGDDSQIYDSPNVTVGFHDLAYIIFTSGSTGRPKGVAIEHGAMVNFLLAFSKRLNIQPKLNWLAVTPLSFDIAVFELFGALINQGKCVIADQTAQVDAAVLAELIKSQGIDLMQTTPSRWTQLLQQPGQWPELIALCGGEPMDSDLQAQLFSRTGKLYNCYGPTEATVWSLIRLVEQADVDQGRVSLGQPLANYQHHVLDENFTVLPQGAIGLLYIGGVGLARGYYRRPELNEQAFIQHPDGRSGRIYNTGDLVRRLPQGGFEFIGRADAQVKLHGFRIELAEIELQLKSVDDVDDAVVMCVGVGAHQHLVAWLVTKVDSQKTMTARARQTLAQCLPEYMIPAVYTLIDALPLTPNGKVDRSALPQSQFVDTHYVKPQGETQIRLAQLWQEVLELDEAVSADGNFFSLGGNSILATRLLGLINAKCEVSLSVRAIFEHDSLLSLAAHIDGQTKQSKVVIERLDHQNASVLSVAQQRLWFIDKLEGGSNHYHMPSAFKLAGPLSVSVLTQTLNTIIARHQVLRSVYVTSDSGTEGLQQVLSQCSVEIAQHDLTNLVGEAQNNAIDQFVAKQVQTPFDLSQDHPIRFVLLKLADDSHVLLVTLHHIAADGWSIRVLEQEFIQLYRAFVQAEPDPLPPLAIQYRDFAHWQHERLCQGVLDEQKQYWLARLDGIPSVHSLPLDKVRPVQQQFSAKRIVTELNGQLTQQISDFAHANDATEYMVLQSAFALLISRLSGESDIVIGSAVSGRGHEDLTPLIGCFINVLLIRTQIDSQQSFSQLLATNRNNILDAQANQDVPFEQLVEWLNPKRSLSHSALFQIYYSHEVDIASTEKLDGLGVERLSISEQLNKYDLNLVTGPTDTGLQCVWTYAESLFEQHTIEMMAKVFEVLLTQLVTQTHAPMHTLTLLDSQQRQQILQSARGVSQQLDDKQTIVTMIEAQVAATPDAIAVEYQGKKLDYQTLNQRANRIAAKLLQHGVKPNDKVGIWLERQLLLPVAILAVAKSGAAYIPIENSNTSARIGQIMDSAEPKAMISDQQMSQSLPDYAGVFIDIEDPLVGFSDENPGISIEHQHSAYLIYTSGSTGTPKGVVISHENLSDYCQFALGSYYQQSLSGSLLVTSHGFDISVPSLFLPLCRGGSVLLSESGMELTHLVDAFASGMGPYLIRMTPMHVHGLLSMLDPQQTINEAHVFVIGGESLSWQLAISLQQLLPNAQLYNHYGPSEATVGCAMYDITANRERLSTASSVPIGQAMANTGLYVLDEHQQLVPDGVCGELYIAGKCVSPGYLNDQAQTDEKFISNPFDLSERCYRSGDLVRRLPSGHLQYLRRGDTQVKLRGFRIEPDEVAVLLKQLDGVDDALVLLNGEGELARLVAYIVSQSQQDSLSEQARNHLAQLLPDYMQPTAYMVLPALPLSANGKVNRRALPEPVFTDTKAYEAPTDDVEIQLVELWQSLLQLQTPISVTANFFDLGGHSLLANRLAGLIRQRFALDVPLRVFFEYQDIRSLAEFIHTTRMLAQQDDDDGDYADEGEL